MATILIAAALLCAVVLAIRYLMRAKKQGRGACASCSGCSGCEGCSKSKKQTQDI